MSFFLGLHPQQLGLLTPFRKKGFVITPRVFRFLTWDQFQSKERLHKNLTTKIQVILTKTKTFIEKTLKRPSLLTITLITYLDHP